MIAERDLQSYSRPQVTEAELDTAADKYGSYDEAFRRLDITPDDVIYEIPVRKERPPIAVNLADRALALADITAFYSKDNQTRGSKTQMHVPESSFSTRYKDQAPAVQEGAEGNRATLLRKFRTAIDTLNATGAMSAYQRQDGDPEIHPDGNGYIHESDIEISRVTLQHDMREELAGVGSESVSKRKRLVRRATAAAKGIHPTS